jgi:hypothetical protein
MDSLIAARQRALELALDNAPNGRSFNAIIGTAKQFADFIINGEAPEKTEDK